MTMSPQPPAEPQTAFADAHRDPMLPLFQSLLGESPLGIGILDSDLRYVYINSRLASINGLPIEAHLGRPVNEVLPDLAIELEPLLRQILATDQPIENLPVRLESSATPNESRYWLVNYYPLHQADGQIVGIGMVIADITGVKSVEGAFLASEEKYVLLAEAIDELVTVRDLDGRIVFVSQSVLKHLGFAPEELIGTDSYAYVHPEDRELIIKDVQEADLRNEATETIWRCRRKDGSYCWLATRTKVLESAGRPRRLMGVSRDITALRQAEEDRLAMERRLLHTQKLESLGVLAGGIAHDFNNLLTAIVGNTELALDELPPDSALRRQLESVKTAARRATELTQQMLAYAGKGRFDVRAVDLNSLVEEITTLLQSSIPKHIGLKYNLAADLPAILADATQIGQVIMNLVINAAEAITDANGVVTVTTRAGPLDMAELAANVLSGDFPDRVAVQLEVADTGAGMDLATRARIFDPFFTTKFTGRGLGLAVVQGIVQSHKGALLVASEPGRGTSFSVFFPALSADTVEEPPAPAARPARWHGSGTVLVVDDEVGVRTVATRILERSGYKVLTAMDGRAGLEIFRAQADTIDCVLLDLTMPQLSGQQTFLEMRQLKPDARIVVMSGYAEEEASVGFIGQAVSGFLHKPFTIEELREVLQAVLAALC